MKKTLTFLIIFCSTIGLSNYSPDLPATKEFKNKFSNDRIFCRTQADYRILRYNSCAYSDEVVVGIQSLNPVVVICSRIGVTCFRLDNDERDPI